MEAQRALAWLRGSGSVHEEMEQMRSEYEAVKLVPKVTMRELITNTALRIPLIISLTIMVAQQLSGINAVSCPIVWLSDTFSDTSSVSGDVFLDKNIYDGRTERG